MTLTADNTTIQHQQTNKLFPIFLNLEELQVLIIGGGHAALDKLVSLIQNSPSTEITLLAKEILPEIKNLARVHENITLVEAAYDPSYLDRADIVIAAVNNAQISEVIQEAANERRILINVAGQSHLSDFFIGSTLQKGNLKIAISTNGKAPSLAKRLKEQLENALPSELDGVADNLHNISKRLNGSFHQKVKKLDSLTKTLVENEEYEKARRWRRFATWTLIVFASMLIGHFIFTYLPLSTIGNGIVSGISKLDSTFPLILAAGFIAQLVDGALGMGYGLTSATILLSAGINPAAISGSIHTAEMFASGASGYSHYKFGNVNKKLFKLIVIPGVIGAIAGAVLLVKFGDSHAKYIKPALATYTLILGIKFIYNAFVKQKRTKKFKLYGPLAGAGGFLDSFGGGGWGPIVTSTLINVGRSPRFVIGTVSLTEFFVTLASAFSFFLMIGVTHWQVIVALILGGLAAAPIAAKLAGKMPRKTAFILLGTLVIVWSGKILWSAFF
jgi:siroheme synthase-like protein